jgi:hypothetical protein
VKKEDKEELREFSCGHAARLESFEMRIQVFGSLLPRPLTILQRAIDEKDWFKGIVMSSVFFELLGIKKLKEHFESKGIGISDKK